MLLMLYLKDLDPKYQIAKMLDLLLELIQHLFILLRRNQIISFPLKIK